MLRNIVITHMASARRTANQCLGLLAWAVVALAVTSGCEQTEPATPTLISVQRHGTFFTGGKLFTFDAPVEDTASNTVIHYVGSTVRFTVPYPTSIELAINGKPLTQVDRPLSRNYEYAGTIENPGANPATWSVGIKTPFDVPFFHNASKPADYVLTIGNVSGSKRSPPLMINYRYPSLQIPFPPSGEHITDPTPPPQDIPGPCAGGAHEQSFRLCLKQPPHDPIDTATDSCSLADAVNLFQPAYPDWTITQGSCGP